MTREEIQRLSNHELQSKLSEILLKNEGFTKATRGAYYIEDMHSMQIAESLMTAKQWTEYLMDLLIHKSDMPAEQIDAIYEHCPHEATALIRGAWHGITVTPRRRAEALLWVLTEVR